MPNGAGAKERRRTERAEATNNLRDTEDLGLLDAPRRGSVVLFDSLDRELLRREFSRRGCRGRRSGRHRTIGYTDLSAEGLQFVETGEMRCCLFAGDAGEAAQRDQQEAFVLGGEQVAERW